MKVSAPLTVTSASPLARDGVIVTLPVGSLSRTTVQVSEPPSDTVTEDADTVTPRASLSVIAIVVSEIVRSLTAVLPPTVSDSPASTKPSSTGVRLKVAVPESSPASMVSAKSATVR